MTTQLSRAARFWLAPACFWAAWLGLSLAVVTPPHGNGVTVCWFKAATGIPCPGCGLTRSMSCALHGMLGESWNYHPLGMAVLLILLLTAAISVLPFGSKQNVRRFIETRASLFNFIYVGFVSLFVGFGFVRACLEIAKHTL